MPPVKIDIPAIIIGAGPAGAGASFFLSKDKIKHIVLEKEVFPRDKVCGDACSGRTTSVINMANPAWLAEMRQNSQSFLPSWGMTVVAPNGKSIDIPYTARKEDQTEAKGFVAARIVLDNFLFEKMASPYCTVYQGAEVTGIERGQNGVVVRMTQGDKEYEISAPVLLGADGDKSIVRKQFLAAHTEAKTSAIGLRAYYDGVTGLHPENFIELHFLPEIPSGYLWVFPLPNGRANVGIGMLSATVREKKINLRELMLHAINNHPRFASRFANAKLLGKIQGWGIPIYSEPQPFSGDNFMLAGDSALMIDPFSGEGIGNALHSGMLAAGAIKQAIAQKDYSAAFFKKEYESLFFKHLGAELTANSRMQKIFKYHWVFNMVFSKAYKSQTLHKVISCMFTDADMQRQLGKPSFFLKVLLNR